MASAGYTCSDISPGLVAFILFHGDHSIVASTQNIEFSI